MEVDFGILDTRLPTEFRGPSPTPVRLNVPATRSYPPRSSITRCRQPEETMGKPTTESKNSAEMTPSDHQLPVSTFSDPVTDMNSLDSTKVKRALAAADPEMILKDLEIPTRPRWVETLEDWVEVHVPRSVFEPWEIRQDDKHTYYEYDGVNERLGIRCLASSIHNSAPSVFQAHGQQELQKLGTQSQAQLMIGPDTEFSGFDFPGLPPWRTKAPDAYLSLKDGEFPLVVMEAGWSESEDRLIKDAQLWLHGSYGAVVFVIIIIVTENKKHICTEGSGHESLKLAETEVDERLFDGTNIDGFEEDGPQASFADVRMLARKLEQLEKEGKLMKQLVGSFEAQMRVYRKVQKGDPQEGITSSNGFNVGNLKIFLSNDAKVFPIAGMTPINLPWADILQKDDKNFDSEDLKKDFVLNPGDFREAIEKAMPQRIKKRALDRAALILEKKGRLEPGPTFGELKRGAGGRNEDYMPSGAQGPKSKKRKTAS